MLKRVLTAFLFFVGVVALLAAFLNYIGFANPAFVGFADALMQNVVGFIWGFFFVALSPYVELINWMTPADLSLKNEMLFEQPTYKIGLIAGCFLGAMALVVQLGAVVIGVARLFSGGEENIPGSTLGM